MCTRILILGYSLFLPAMENAAKNISKEQIKMSSKLLVMIMFQLSFARNYEDGSANIEFMRTSLLRILYERVLGGNVGINNSFKSKTPY